jgi:hypothetical protein
MNYQHEITRLRETKNNDAVLAINVSVPDDGSMPISDVYCRSFDEDKPCDFYFWTNSTILDTGITLSNEFWCVDNEGHVFTTTILDESPLPLLEGVFYEYENKFLNTVNAYRLSDLPIYTLWCNDRLTIVADEAGTVFHIEDGKITSYSSCPFPLSFFGSSSDDLYLYGRKAKLWHFNGEHWTEIILPDIGLDYLAVSGGVSLSDGDIVFVTSYGFVFRGHAKKGFVVCDVPKKPYTGIAKFQERYFVSVQDEGLFEITNIEDNWRLDNISSVRLPLSLNTMGKGQHEALFVSSAFSIGKPYFVAITPGSDVGTKKNEHNWEINIE